MSAVNPTRDATDRAMDMGSVHIRTPFRIGAARSADDVERALAGEADMLLDWLDVQSWSSHVPDCTSLLKAAVKAPIGQKRRTMLRAAIDATRRCFFDAPRVGERDAWC